MAGKRTYQKPILLVEDLNMTRSIAAGCGFTNGTNLSDGNTCYWSDGTGFEKLFNNLVNICDAAPDEDGLFFCYTNMESERTIFNS